MTDILSEDKFNAEIVNSCKLLIAETGKSKSDLSQYDACIIKILTSHSALIKRNKELVDVLKTSRRAINNIRLAECFGRDLLIAEIDAAIAKYEVKS